jgi:hypothetical protein
MKKLNKKQIEEIKESKEGLLAIARKYKVNPNTIKYYRSKKFRDYLREYQKKRYKNMNKEQKEKYKTERKGYQKKYQRDKYQNDPEFRKKQLERAKKYQREHYAKTQTDERRSKK